MSLMQAIVLEEYNNIQWKEVPKPEYGSNDILIKVSFACICGSDQHIFKGEFHPRTSLPLVMGHEFSGIVEETGNEVKNFDKGEKVVVDPIVWCGECPACEHGHYPACKSLKLVGIDMDGGFGEYIAVPQHMVYKVRGDIPLEHAALVEVLSIGFHACHRAGVKEGDNLVIWGAGKVGQCILQASRVFTRGTIIMVDIVDERLDMAKNAYQDIITINPEKQDPVKKIMATTGDKGVDIAFEAVGHAKQLENVFHPVRSCIQSIRGGGKVCVLGLANEPAPVVMKELIWKEGIIVTSRVSHGEYKDTLKYMEEKKLKPEKLITGIMHPSKALNAFRILEEEPEKQLKVLLHFD